MYLNIGVEVKRRDDCSLIVCGFNPDAGKIQTYRKNRISEQKMKEMFGNELRIIPGIVLTAPNNQQMMILDHCGSCDFYFRILGEILEFTAPELIDFHAEANYKWRPEFNPPLRANPDISRPKNRSFSRCRSMAKICED